jgi:hypothetical protein
MRPLTASLLVGTMAIVAAIGTVGCREESDRATTEFRALRPTADHIASVFHGSTVEETAAQCLDPASGVEPAVRVTIPIGREDDPEVEQSVAARLSEIGFVKRPVRDTRLFDSSNGDATASVLTTPRRTVVELRSVRPFC